MARALPSRTVYDLPIGLLGEEPPEANQAISQGGWRRIPLNETSPLHSSCPSSVSVLKILLKILI